MGRPDDPGSQEPEERGVRRLRHHQWQPRDEAELEQPVQQQAVVDETEHESQEGAGAASPLPHRPQQRDQRDEGQGPGVEGRVRREQKDARGRGGYDAGRQRQWAVDQTQSLQYMRFLSASWLRMGFTR